SAGIVNSPRCPWAEPTDAGDWKVLRTAEAEDRIVATERSCLFEPGVPETLRVERLEVLQLVRRHQRHAPVAADHVIGLLEHVAFEFLPDLGARLDIGRGEK